MKKLLVCTLVLACVAVCGPAFANCGSCCDDLSWWGQSGATPAPVADTGGSCGQAARSGYWWWPTEPKSNVDDGELWGNRGVVYGMYVEPAAPPPPPPPPPKKKTESHWIKPTFAHVLFDFDKSTLKPEGKAECDKVVAELKKNSKEKVEIQGHTCNVGEEAYNMGLGQRRADSVAKYLVEQGISESRITTKSFGETEPAVPNDTPANRKLNRRAIFDVTLK